MSVSGTTTVAGDGTMAPVVEIGAGNPVNVNVSDGTGSTTTEVYRLNINVPPQTFNSSRLSRLSGAHSARNT